MKKQCTINGDGCINSGFYTSEIVKTFVGVDATVCSNCRKKYLITCTKTTATKEYRLKAMHLDQLRSCEIKNPHYSSAKPMKLFLLSEVQDFSDQLHNGRKVLIEKFKSKNK